MKFMIDALKEFVKRDAKAAFKARRSSRSNSLTFETLQPRQLLAAIAVASGDWSDENVWQDQMVPSADERVIISNGVTVELDEKDYFVEELVIQGELVVPEDVGTNANKSLTTRWIHVNSGGLFRVGSSDDRFDEGTFTVNLTGTDTEADHSIEGVMMPIVNNDGFLMTSGAGRVEFFGDEKLSFTKLAASVGANSREIIVNNVIERNFNANSDDIDTSATDDGELNWEEDDQIVIASSSYDYTEEEVRIIEEITDNGNGTSTILLDVALEHDHYGLIEEYGDPSSPIKIDLRAEVALLSRNIKIQGDLDQDTDETFGDRSKLEVEDRVRASGLSDSEWEKLPGKQVANGVGGHLMFMGSSGPIKIDGVQLNGLGQAGQKGRYPIHWHLGDNRPDDLFRNSSVTNSNNRGVTIHGTSGLTIEGVVLHDIHGHGFFFEDAVETDNRLVSNIAIGIHAVGGNDQNFASPGSKDPFVVDTHDSVLETGSRFSSSAAFWITNPDNTFVGNIAAGAGDQRTEEWAEPAKGVAAGTGFWYAIPRKALGSSGEKTQYENVNPIFAEFGKFDFNTSHTTAVGLNFDRGSDIEDANFDSDAEFGDIQTANEYSPREGGIKSGQKLNDELASVVKGFTNYKASDAAVYHRGDGESIQFSGLRIADSLNGPWAVSETTYTDSLFVGHSKGNADPLTKVGGPRLYDGAGLYSNTHFAGFSGANAFAFQVEGSSFGPTMYHAFEATTFENDETSDSVAHAVSDFQQDPAEGHDLSRPFKWIKGVVDLDGTLTSGAGGGVGSSIVPNIDFLIEDHDVIPDGWDAVLTNDFFARIRVENFNDGSDKELFPSDSNGRTVIRFTARDGDSVDVVNGQNGGDHSWVQIAAKADGDGEVEGTFAIEFGQGGVPEDGFVLNMRNQDGGRPQLVSSIQNKVDAARIVVKVVAAGAYTPIAGSEVFTEAELRAATDGVVYYRDGLGNLLLNTGIRDDQPLIELIPGAPLQTPFAAHTISYGTVIEAEDFDNGINSNGNTTDGIAFHDSDAANSLGSYRSDTGVDVTENKVGDIADGEWLEYTANVVPSAYDIGLRVSSNQAGGQIRVLAAKSNSSGFVTDRSLPEESLLGDFGVVNVPDTGGEFQTVWIEGANLFPVATEDSVIRLEFIGGGFEIDSMEFRAPDQQPYQAERIIAADLATSVIELEEFDHGGQGVAYFDDTPGNDENKIGDEDNHFREDEDVDANDSQLNGKVFEGEWLEYTTDVQPGLYDITLAKKWGGAGDGVKLFIGESNTAIGSELVLLHEFEFTGSDPEDLTIEDVDLTHWAGADRVFRIEIVGNWMGLDKLEFVSKTQVAPQVESLVIGDGSSQRSMVSSVTVNFSETVVGLDESSFSLMNTTSNTPVIPSVTTELVGGKTVATLTFSGAGIEGGSLADGDYELTVFASGIADAAGNSLDGNGDGVSGDNAVDAFFRFFGDSDGNRTVNIFDLLDFRKAYRGTDAAFDSNGDGIVNVFDLLEFRKRYRNSL